MQTKTKPEKPANKTVSTPASAVENNDTIETLEASFEQAYKAAGAILAQIRVQKLYAPKYGSFTEYAKKRWENQTRFLWKKVLAVAQNGAKPEPKPEPKAEAPKAEAPKAAKKAAKKTAPVRAQDELDAKKAAKATAKPEPKLADKLAAVGVTA
jgi:hypothetical protein